jgi:hypothetical protein
MQLQPLAVIVTYKILVAAAASCYPAYPTLAAAAVSCRRGLNFSSCIAKLSLSLPTLAAAAACCHRG